MPYSKDRENGMPGFVADSDKPFVKLVSTEDAQSLEYRRIGLKTPGWSYHKQITREGGGFRNLTETLVAFSGAGTKIGPSGSGGIAVISRPAVIPAIPQRGVEATLRPGVYTGATAIAKVLTINGRVATAIHVGLNTLNGITRIPEHGKFVTRTLSSASFNE